MKKLSESFGLSEFGSLGTLGGGNHFIEIDEGMDLWAIVHSGSRDIGKKVAEHYIELSAEFEYNPDALLKEMQAGK